MTLSPQQIRVLGALIEKEIATPDLYPLSLNSLQAACNQRSSRDPVLDLTDDDVRTALHLLQDAGLAGAARGSLNAPAGRVSKFEHHARTALNLRRDEVAVLCLLLLRGPQTPGELRARADRLYSFDDLSAVTATLDRLAAPLTNQAASTPDPHRPLVAILPRQPGSREARYRHLLGGTNDRAEAASDPILSPISPEVAPNPPQPAHRLLDLEARIAALEQRIVALEAGRPKPDHPAPHLPSPSPPSSLGE